MARFNFELSFSPEMMISLDVTENGRIYLETKPENVVERANIDRNDLIRLRDFLMDLDLGDEWGG